MKELLLVLFAITSVATFAETENVFVGTSTEVTSLIGTTGCVKAKREAINNAKIQCMDAGYRKCKKINVIKAYSNAATIDLFGKCTFKAYYEGVE